MNTEGFLTSGWSRRHKLRDAAQPRAVGRHPSNSCNRCLRHFDGDAEEFAPLEDHR